MNDRTKLGLLLTAYMAPSYIGIALMLIGSLGHIAWMRWVGVALLLSTVVRRPIWRQWLGRRAARQADTPPST